MTENGKGLYRLTNRQEQVIKLMCEGSTQTEVAKTLCVTYGTIKNHLQLAKKRTGIKTSWQLCAEWARWDERKKLRITA